MLNKELSHFSESKSGNQISEYICSTFLGMYVLLHLPIMKLMRLSRMLLWVHSERGDDITMEIELNGALGKSTAYNNASRAVKTGIVQGSA